ncbi:MAG: DUF454 domain-containing protein [Candidatus Eisenbacteria bacterium]|nr:DUF454 domain-containing protein [Candidatus Eisenbacteria bacterium]
MAPRIRGAKSAHGLPRTLLQAAGTLSVALGVVGIFVPLLPTTPFLLLAAYCYGRSSERFHRWLLENRWFGEYVRDYREGRGLRRREKARALFALWLTIGIGVCFFASAWWLRLLLIGAATGVTIHLLRLRTCEKATPHQIRLMEPRQGEVGNIERE